MYRAVYPETAHPTTHAAPPPAPLWLSGPGPPLPAEFHHHTAPPWTPSAGFIAHSHPASTPTDGCFGLVPSQRPPVFGFPPPGHHPMNMPPPTVPSGPEYSCVQRLPVGFDSNGGWRQKNEKLPDRPARAGWRTRRREDRQWLGRFLGGRQRGSNPQQQEEACVPGDPRGLRQTLDGATSLVSAIRDVRQALTENVEKDGTWADSYRILSDLKTGLEDKIGRCLAAHGSLGVLTERRRRRRRLRARRPTPTEGNRDKEAAIDLWRMKRINDVKEKIKEQELKQTADLVLSEVRKKQADVHRMRAVMRSLEKLRRLRAEAASRTGIVTDPGCEEVFVQRLEQLRSVTQRRSVVYSIEEKALTVMLEGEREEERRQARDREAKKEREAQLKRKQEVDVMLFGGPIPSDITLQPFQQYHSQAQHSLEALVQIRRGWDAFVVPVDHPDGSSVPHSWILPDPPSHRDWDSALQMPEHTRA